MSVPQIAIADGAAVPEAGLLPTVAVVVVNWNAGGLLRKCVDSILAQICQPGRILVVDNGSTDGSLDGLGELSPRVEIVRLNENLGFAAANNHAVACLPEEIEWVALLNPDAVAAPRWLQSLLAAAGENRDFSLFASRAVQSDRPEFLDGAGDVYHFTGLAWRNGYGRKVSEENLRDREVFSPCAAAALYRRSAWVETGGMDEKFFCYLEDVDLGFRMRLLGYRCLYVADAVVEHAGSYSTGRDSDFSVYHGHRNLVWCFFKNLPLPLLMLCIGPHLLMNLLTFVILTVQGRGRTMVRAKVDAVAGLPAILEQRKPVQQSRRVGAFAPWRWFSFALFRR